MKVCAGYHAVGLKCEAHTALPSYFRALIRKLSLLKKSGKMHIMCSNICHELNIKNTIIDK